MLWHQGDNRSRDQFFKAVGDPAGIMLFDHLDGRVVKRRNKANRKALPDAPDDAGMSESIWNDFGHPGLAAEAIPGACELARCLPGSSVCSYPPDTPRHLCVSPAHQQEFISGAASGGR